MNGDSILELCNAISLVDNKKDEAGQARSTAETVVC